MLKRLVEDWLDNATERTFQGPFCQMLAARGHKVVHLSRHCAMEMGKDIITIDRRGRPCCYQLKSAVNGRFSLTAFRDIHGQIDALLDLAPAHPEVPGNKKHCGYLVTNGVLEEEAARAVIDYNVGRHNRRAPELQVISRGQLLKWASELGDDLWPTELRDVRVLLELYVSDGEGQLPKDKLARLLEYCLPLRSDGARGGKHSVPHCRRALASAALLTALASSSFEREENHWAVIEAWVLFASYAMALAEKWGLPQDVWQPRFNLARLIIRSALRRLALEAGSARSLVQGTGADALVDPAVMRVRVTLLLGLLSVSWLWPRHLDDSPDEELDAATRSFIVGKTRQAVIWGEAAVPQWLALFWCLRHTGGTCAPDLLLGRLLGAIVQSNKAVVRSAGKAGTDDTRSGLANPYYSFDDVALPQLRLPAEPPRETFIGNAYTAESLLHMLVALNWKQTVKRLWPDFTRMTSAEFVPKEKWQFLRWLNERQGRLEVRVPRREQEWAALVSQARDFSGSSMPAVLKHDPVFVLLFLIVYPHRMNSDVTRWLLGQLDHLSI